MSKKPQTINDDPNVREAGPDDIREINDETSDREDAEPLTAEQHDDLPEHTHDGDEEEDLPDGSILDTGTRQPGSGRSGQWTITKNPADDLYYFALKSSNGQLLVISSEGYKRRLGAERGINAVRSFAADKIVLSIE